MPRLSKRAIFIRKCESIAEHQVRKAFICLRFDDEDLRALIIAYWQSLYCLRGAYRQWDSNWERMLEDGMYMSDDEFLSNFHMD